MKLSALVDHRSFALLGPGFTGGRWLLIDELRVVPRGGRLLYVPYESRGDAPVRLDGRIIELDAIDIDVDPCHILPTFDEDMYAHGVEDIRSSIAAGDVYQVNLTTRVDLGVVSAASLFARLLAQGSPRFAAWVRTDDVEFVSASPELFFRVEGRTVTAEPMKGTAGVDGGAALAASGKDDAELAMITDLMRNDLTRLCVARSVRVVSERRLMQLPYAVQAVSEVQGTLDEGVGVEAVLAALHPGGSITGAPKEAAVERIAQLESDAREAYCGALAFVGDRATVASMLIRTAFRRGDRFLFGVGAGITWASEAASEVAELHTKLGALR